MSDLLVVPIQNRVIGRSDCSDDCVRHIILTLTDLEVITLSALLLETELVDNMPAFNYPRAASSSSPRIPLSRSSNLIARKLRLNE